MTLIVFQCRRALACVHRRRSALACVPRVYRVGTVCVARHLQTLFLFNFKTAGLTVGYRGRLAHSHSRTLPRGRVSHCVCMESGGRVEGAAAGGAIGDRSKLKSTRARTHLRVSALG